MEKLSIVTNSAVRDFWKGSDMSFAILTIRHTSGDFASLGFPVPQTKTGFLSWTSMVFCAHSLPLQSTILSPITISLPLALDHLKAL
jgi:hypothetical protein